MQMMHLISNENILQSQRNWSKWRTEYTMDDYYRLLLNISNHNLYIKPTCLAKKVNSLYNAWQQSAVTWEIFTELCVLTSIMIRGLVLVMRLNVCHKSLSALCIQSTYKSYIGSAIYKNKYISSPVLLWHNDRHNTLLPLSNYVK